MNNSQENVGREVKIDTHVWNDMGFYCNHKRKKKSKNGRQTALQEIRKEIIIMTNYEKTKTMFFRTNAQHADRHFSTIAVVEGQCRELAHL